MFESSEKFRREQRQKAQELRRSRWWQNQIQSCPCYYCGVSLTPQSATMDHLLPVSQGGQSTRGNVVAACKPCNATKRNQTLIDLALDDASKSN